MAVLKKNANSSSLHLYLFGACRVEVGGRAIDLRRKPKQLLKLLSLQPQQRLHREQIVDLLWTDQEPEAAANNLHKTVHAARRALEPDVNSGNDSHFILTKEGQIILTAPNELWIDAVEFEKLSSAALKSNDDAKACENALALYAGDLLPEDLYEDWASEKREYLRTTYRKLLQKLTAIYESKMQFEQSAEIARKLVSFDELDEDAHRSLMRLYALGGNRQQAVKQFEVCRAVLRKELGVEPERGTRELFEQIASGKLAPQKNQTQFPAVSEKTSKTQIKTNLPHQLTSFVGRAGEIEEIRSLLKTARLLTLTGAGGIGKTRLALEAAGKLLDEFRDGIYLIELAALNDSALVVRAACAALGAGEDVTRPLVETLRDFLREKQILLIFDNCEQIVAACAALVADLLRHCPDLRVLATSREALDTPGEIVWSVSTLSLPSEVRLKTAPADLADYESVQLFVERARLVNPHFSLAANNSEIVARLCRQLDGIPLAIELAAARVRVLSVEQIAARLDNSLQILTSGGRTTVPRHQTLRAAIDWSYEILSAPEQATWRALSIFAGGFTLEAAEFVCADASENDSVLDLLTHLIDKSIITASERQAETRYSMLETIRQYGAEKLRESGEENHIRGLHYQWFLKLAERAEREFSKLAQREWFERLEIELDNLRAAFERSSSEPQDAIQALKLANALWHFWQSSGRLEEGRRWFEIALEKDDAPPELRAIAFHRLGDLAVLQCDFADAEKIYENALALSRLSENRADTARLLYTLGFTLVNRSEFERAAPLFAESLEICREMRDAKGNADALNGLGVLAYYRGDYEQASKNFGEALEICRALDYKIGIIRQLHNVGTTAHLQNNLDKAEKHLRESLQLAGDLGERRWINQTRHVLGYVCNDKGSFAEADKFFAHALTLDPEIGGKDNIAQVLEGLACAAAAAQKNYFRSLLLAAFADRLREEIKTPRSQTLQNYFDGYWNIARQNISPEDAIRASAEARAMTLDEAVRYALQNE